MKAHRERPTVLLYSFFTSALLGGEKSNSRPGYPQNRRLGGKELRFRQFGEVIHSLLMPGYEPRTVQPVT
jgi:hypothetical protein